MNIDEQYIKTLIQLYAEQNSDAYRDGRNIKTAIRLAKVQLIKEFAEALQELTKDAEAELYQTWYVDEIREAKNQELYGFIREIEAGAEFAEITEETYEHWLGMLPPVRMRNGSFYFSEGRRDNEKGQGVHWFFYQEGGKYYVTEKVLA